MSPRGPGAGDPDLDPRVAEILVRVERAARPPLHTLSPAQARAAYLAAAPVLDIRAPDMARIDSLSIPVADGARVPARLYWPTEPSWAAPLPLLVYYHGGGFTIGSVATHEPLCRALAAESGGAVLSVDYRLAPEHRFPTAVDDAWHALRWVAGEASALGLDAGRIAVGGDSAGGTLAAVTAVLARDAGLPLALQLLFYPGTGARQDTDSHQRYADGYLLPGETIAWFLAQYRRDDRDREDWRYAPLDAAGAGADVRGVAPAWIGLAQCDPLHDEGEAYAAKLRAADVPTALSKYAGMIHDFIKMGGFVPAARRAHADAGAALRRAWAAAPAG